MQFFREITRSPQPIVWVYHARVPKEWTSPAALVAVLDKIAKSWRVAQEVGGVYRIAVSLRESARPLVLWRRLAKEAPFLFKRFLYVAEDAEEYYCNWTPASVDYACRGDRRWEFVTEFADRDARNPETWDECCNPVTAARDAAIAWNMPLSW